MDGNGKVAVAVTRYHYDWKNRMVKKETPYEGGWEDQYDQNDRLITDCFDGMVQSRRTYDLRGNVR